MESHAPTALKGLSPISGGLSPFSRGRKNGFLPQAVLVVSSRAACSSADAVSGADGSIICPLDCLGVGISGSAPISIIGRRIRRAIAAPYYFAHKSREEEVEVT